jgi:hypothetical protein
MLTHAQCIAKVAEMELQAIVHPQQRDEYLQLARQWDWLADHVRWHERYEDRFL